MRNVIELLSDAENEMEATFHCSYFIELWNREFHGLVVHWDERRGIFITRLEFEFVNLYFHHFKLGECGLEVDSLADVLIKMGMSMGSATTEVKLSDTYLSVTRIPRPTREDVGGNLSLPKRTLFVTRDVAEGLAIKKPTRQWITIT